MDPIERIERELTMLLRRGRSIHVSTAAGEVELERSSYGIMLLLSEAGSMRLGEIARVSGVDASTITRQVQALERVDLVHRLADEADRRAARLELTDEGRRTLDEVKQLRRAWLRETLAVWPAQDREQLGVLLSRLNAAIDDRFAADDARATPPRG